MDCIIGLDIGTSSTKAIAFGSTGEIIAEHKISYPILNPKSDYFEQDPEEIFQAVIESIAFVSNTLKANKQYTLSGIGISCAMHSLIAVGEKGNPLTNCIIWADSRSKGFATQIKNSTEGHDIYMKTGTPIHPMSPLCKLAWMRENMKEIFDASYKFISIKEYVCYKLFKTYMVDYSIASATGLFNIHSLEWYLPALKVAGISSQQLSEPVPITTVLSNLDIVFADLMGLKGSIPFVIGGSDGCLANLGVNAIKPGDAAVTIGTSGAIRVMTNKPNTDTKARIFSYLLTEDKFVLGGAVNNGGVILRWFKENFADEEVSDALKDGTDVYDALIKKAATIPPGSDGLVFLPYLMGERAPHWNTNVKGVFFGMQLLHTKAHFIRAVLEGIIFGIYSVGKVLEETTGDINVIFANGGFAKSSDWVQMLADVFNKKVLIAESYESAALGAAIVAFKALGIIDRFEDIGRLVPIVDELTPNLINHHVYMKNFALFERLYEKLKDEF